MVYLIFGFLHLSLSFVLLPACFPLVILLQPNLSLSLDNFCSDVIVAWSNTALGFIVFITYVELTVVNYDPFF